MGLAAAREIFGPVPCVLEDVEFQTIPVSRRGHCARGAGEARHGVERVLRLCPHRGLPTIPGTCTRTDASGRRPSRPRRPSISRKFVNVFPSRSMATNASVGSRPPDSIMARRSRESRGYGAAIGRSSPRCRSRRACTRTCPTIGCIRRCSMPASRPCCRRSRPGHDGQDAKDEIFVPVKIERVRFQCPASDPHVRLHPSDAIAAPTELKVDLQVVDEAGAVLAEVQGLTARPSGHRVQRTNGTLYEYQWKLSPRRDQRAPSGTRITSRRRRLWLPSCSKRARLCTSDSIATRFQNEFQHLSRSTAARLHRARFARAGLDAGTWAALPVESSPSGWALRRNYHRWLALMLKELTAGARWRRPRTPSGLWKALWDEFPECQAELTLVATLRRETGGGAARRHRSAEGPLPGRRADDGGASSTRIRRPFALGNLLLQKAVAEIVRAPAEGKGAANPGDRRRHRRD